MNIADIARHLATAANILAIVADAFESIDKEVAR